LRHSALGDHPVESSKTYVAARNGTGTSFERARWSPPHIKREHITTIMCRYT
jgi:hypothetical protein